MSSILSAHPTQTMLILQIGCSPPLDMELFFPFYSTLYWGVGYEIMILLIRQHLAHGSRRMPTLSKHPLFKVYENECIVC